MTDITFTVFKKSYADNLSDAAFQTALKTDLDALTCNTVYELSIKHVHGFWVVILVYA